MAYRKITRFVTAADGTEIAYHTHLGSDLAPEQEDTLRSRPTVLLTNGIGTTENFWRYLVDALSGTHRIVHWDYRGHGSTENARSGDYSIPTQAQDLIRVTEAVMGQGSSGPPLQVAFSMGVAVLLELFRVRPELVPAMALIAGAPDAPGSTVFPLRSSGVQRALRGLLARMTPVVPYVAPAIQRLLVSPLAYPAGRALGLLRARAPREDIQVFMQGLGAMDPLAYWHTLRALMEASASDVLPRVNVPVLVIAASHDVLIPESQVHKMREGIPHARWMRVDDAGHAGLLEAGSEVAAALEAFFRELQDRPQRVA